MVITLEVDGQRYSYVGQRSYSYALDFCLSLGITAPEVTVLESTEVDERGKPIDQARFRMMLRAALARRQLDLNELMLSIMRRHNSSIRKGGVGHG